MYKLRIRHQKTGELRFLSHLDLVRAFERGFRRADLPLSFSCGFSPRPKISFGPPLPVGVSSESEYIDLVLSECPPLSQIASSLRSAFPEDLCCGEIRYIPLKTSSLMSAVTIASYGITLSFSPMLTSAEIQHYIDLVLSKEQVVLPTKNGEKLYKIDKIVKRLDLDNVEEDVGEFSFVGLLGSAGGVRPDTLIDKVFSFEAKPPQIKYRQIHRTGLYREKNSKLIRP